MAHGNRSWRFKVWDFVAINVVPLIDVLLVIFMIIPHSQKGLQAELPQPAPPEDVRIQPEVIVVQVLADGSLRINEERVKWEAFEERRKDSQGPGK